MMCKICNIKLAIFRRFYIGHTLAYDLICLKCLKHYYKISDLK